jgi:hypothetical protein
MVQSPFELTLNYNNTQIINVNFTITTKLNYDTLLPINCEKNRYRLCLVQLALQIQADTMSIEFWCQPPAFSAANFNQSHTCILPVARATQQPSITMIVNSHDKGKLLPLVTANFTYSPEYSIEKQAEIPIIILVKKLESSICIIQKKLYCRKIRMQRKNVI